MDKYWGLILRHRLPQSPCLDLLLLLLTSSKRLRGRWAPSFLRIMPTRIQVAWLSNWELERQQQTTYRSCNSLVVALPVVGVAGAILGTLVVVMVVAGVGCGATLIISKSSSGSFAMFLSLSAAPLVHAYLP